MANNSVYKVTFSIQNGGGKVISGPWNANVGISGGSSGDQPTHAVANSLITAITNNLSGIIGSAVGGTVVIDTYAHAQTPNVWV